MEAVFAGIELPTTAIPSKPVLARSCEINSARIHPTHSTHLSPDQHPQSLAAHTLASGASGSSGSSGDFT